MSYKIANIILLISSIFFTSTSFSKDGIEAHKEHESPIKQSTGEVVERQSEVIKVIKVGRGPRIDELHQRAMNNQQPNSHIMPSGEINPMRLPESLKAKQAANARKATELKDTSSTESAVQGNNPSESTMAASQFEISAYAPAAQLSIEGYSNQDNLNLIGRMLNPPDANGDVGQDHYVQVANLGWMYFNKSDGSLAGGPYLGNSFWQGFGGDCETKNSVIPLCFTTILPNVGCLANLQHMMPGLMGINASR